MTHTYLLWIWIAFISVVTMAAFGFDKNRARDGSRRIPERDLLLLTAVGGTIGGWLGMRLFRHKTRKDSFSRAFFFIAAAQCAIVILFDISA